MTRFASSSWPCLTTIKNSCSSEKTNDLSESQPTKGNIAGGLTTIEEKALGNVEKLGKKTKFIGCLKPAEMPTDKGLWFMDTSSAAAEAVTLWAASGAVVHLFPTGPGQRDRQSH